MLKNFSPLFIKRPKKATSKSRQMCVAFGGNSIRLISFSLQALMADNDT